MKIPIFQIREYLCYQLRAVNAHGLHSPFLYDLYTKVIRKARVSNELKQIRKEVFSSKEKIQFTDPRSSDTSTITLGSWAKSVTSQPRFSSFLIALLNWLEVETVLETGTATGINACSLASSNAREIITLEGSPEIARAAISTIEQFGKGKVKLIEGRIQDTFGNTIRKHEPDFIFLDADHRRSTIALYLSEIATLPKPPRVIVIHDIYWSEGMKEAWQSAVADPCYNLTIDLFQAGIIFPNHPTQKQHFTIRF